MNFASNYILDKEEEEYERVSEDEFKEGMQLSDSDSDIESDNVYANVPRDSDRSLAPARLDAGRGGGVINAIQNLLPSRKKKAKIARKKKEHHWKHSLDEPVTRAMVDSGSSSQKYFRKADTNVVSVNFSTLLSPGHMHAGDPVSCSSCQGILSHISKVGGDTENKTWTCEFCSNEMHVDLEDEEIAKGEDVTYLLEPGNATKSTTLSGQDRALVIFCVDTSGSMCVTTEVEGKVKLRGTGHLQRLQAFNPEGEDQYLPSQRRRDVSYISRLQAMQAAVGDQLETMAKDVPDRRIGLVTFNNDVTIVGDGHQEEVTLAGDKLTNLEQLMKEGSEVMLPQDIRNSRKILGEKVYRLEEGGATALGPALVVAVSMASHHPGSKVIVCTDGKANIGLGKLEDDVDEQNANDFYTNVGESAVSKGVSISVITIKGTDCKLVHLGKLAEKTGGQVNIVDPLNLTKEFGNILADPIIATNVKGKFVVYKALYVINEDDPDSRECYAEYSPGNVKSSTAITFEFGRRSPRDKDSVQSKEEPEYANATEASRSVKDEGDSGAAATASSSSSTASLPSDYPFQLQIHYTDTEGSRALRVITKTMPATNCRNLAEKSANMHILGAHAAKKSADLALQGQYSRSRGVVLMNQRFAWRKSHSNASSKSERSTYKNIYSKLKTMENRLQQKQQAEITQWGSTRSDSEGDEDDVVSELPLATATKKSRSSKFRRINQARSSEMDDDLANVVYNMRCINPDAMAAPQDDDSEDDN